MGAYHERLITVPGTTASRTARGERKILSTKETAVDIMVNGTGSPHSRKCCGGVRSSGSVAFADNDTVLILGTVTCCTEGYFARARTVTNALTREK